jgi:AraC family transcriptional regulator
METTKPAIAGRRRSRENGRHMILCIGEPLCPPGWTGLPLGRFAPPGHGTSLPVAAVQDTLFVWNDGASAARVRCGSETQHYERYDGVLDIMTTDDECFIEHDTPESPGSCLLVAFPAELRQARGAGTNGDDLQFRSRFGFRDEHLRRLARCLEAQCRDAEPFGRLFTDTLSEAFLERLAAHHAAAPGPTAETGRRTSGTLSPQARAKVYRYIDDHLASDIGLDDLARLVDCSPQHFQRLFKKTFGASPYQFVLGLRIDRAKALIRRGTLPIAEVAAACGFSDQSHFSTSFSRRVGVAPSRYRQHGR